MGAADGPFVLGIDTGSQSVRAGIFALDGTLLGAATHPCETFYPKVTWAEQNAAEWWKALRITVPAALAQAGLRGEDITALSVDGTSCTVVCCGRDGTVLRPAIMWMDQRAFSEARRVSLTQDPVLQYVSGHESAEWMIPKALWLKVNEPEIYESADLIVEGTDWLTFRLTGEWTASLCNATAKWNYARPAGGYPVGLLEAVNASELLNKWPTQVLPLGAPAGELSASAAAELGLKAGTLVARGGIDAYAATLGSGVVVPGRMAMVMGSSTCHMALSDQAIFGSHVWGPYPDALIDGTWVLEGGQTATGSILAWLADNFAGRETAEASRGGEDRFAYLDAKAAEIPPGAEGLVVLDYWQGNRTPLRDPLARGAIWGLSLRHSLPHVWRAVLEGTAMGSRHIIEDLAEAGFTVEGIYACGGGARSDLWLQIHADITGIPLYLSALTHEASVLGTAMCAAVGAGLFPDLKSAAEAMVRIERQIDPNSANHGVYRDLYSHYLATYPALRDLMHEVAREE